MNRYRNLICLAMVATMCFVPRLFAVTGEDVDQSVKKHDTTFYREFFNKIIYDQFAHMLRFDELADDVTFKKRDSLDVNLFDEVPDSSFFTNRQGKLPVPVAELKAGPEKGSGPNPQGPWKVTKGKVEGITAGFFIEDQKGDRYLLKFDPKENPEMATAAEIISHKLFYAIGYNVAEYYLVFFDPKILEVDPKATYYNEDGFKKPLDQAALEELLDKIPKMKGGMVRASASRILDDVKGYTPFEGRRDDDPEDLIPHEDRRSIRALRVFGAWLNHYDLREGNTMDVVEEKDGKKYIRHYLIDFASTFGSAASHAKVPAAGYENIVDWLAMGSSTSTFKLVSKDWERRWDTLKHEIPYPELGYFDNTQFDPGKWKTQLPYEVFSRLTASDTFWATKILASFTDEQIQAAVETGQFSNPENAKVLASTLAARRDMISRYWFAKSTALDKITLFKLENNSYEIRFEDLSVKYGFAKPEETKYRLSVNNSEPLEFDKQSFQIKDPAPGMKLFVQAKHGSSDWSEPELLIVLKQDQGSLAISEIDHSA